MINYKHLHYFWAVAKQGGIVRASEHLHLTPQTISGQISLLEDSLGEDLFTKVGRNLELTEVGRLVLGYAEDRGALVDPLPAGLEPLNPSLDVSTTPRPDDSPTADESYWCWCWTWYDHVNLRDDRAEAFAAWLGAGVYEYTYEARATTPGEFVVPPARAEEIYAPEVFGRSASTRVIITD